MKLKYIWMVAALCAVFSVTAHAEGTLSYTNEEKGIVNFTGNIDVSDFNLETADKYVTYKVIDSKGAVNNFGQVRLDDTGNIDFSFRIKGETGEYTLILSNRRIPQETYTINYVNYMYTDFVDAKEASGTDSEKYEIMRNFLKESGSLFGFDVKAFELLDAPETLPGDGTTPQEIVVNTFRQAEIQSDEELTALAQGEKFDGMTVTDLLFVTEKTSDDIIDYITDDVNNVDEEKAIFDKGRAGVFINKLKKEQQTSVADSIRGERLTEPQKDKFEFETLKSFINSLSYQTDMEQIILEENNIWGFSETDIAKYKDSNKNSVQLAMQKGIANVSSVEEYTALLGSYADKYPASTGSGGSSGGSGSSGGGGGGGGSSSGGSAGIASKPITNGNGKEVTNYKAEGPGIFNEKESEEIETESNSVDFKDLGGYEWAEEAINGLVKNYIVNGVSSTEYAPSRTITREEFVKMLTSGLRLTGAEAEVSFSDVHGNDWFYAAVGAAERIGIVNGDSEGKFGVGKNITREDAAVMIARAASVRGVALEGENDITFGDDNDISGYARDGVYMLANAGIVNGDNTGNFAPKNNLTRAEAAKLLYGFFKTIGTLKW